MGSGCIRTCNKSDDISSESVIDFAVMILDSVYLRGYLNTLEYYIGISDSQISWSRKSVISSYLLIYLVCYGLKELQNHIWLR